MMQEPSIFLYDAMQCPGSSGDIPDSWLIGRIDIELK